MALEVCRARRRFLSRVNAAKDEEAAALFQSIDRQGIVDDAVAAVAYLKRSSSNGKSAIGFCFGGGIEPARDCIA